MKDFQLMHRLWIPSPETGFLAKNNVLIFFSKMAFSLNPHLDFPDPILTNSVA